MAGNAEAPGLGRHGALLVRKCLSIVSGLQVKSVYAACRWA